MVATMMSSNVSALKSTSVMSQGTNQDFSKVIQHATHESSKEMSVKQTSNAAHSKEEVTELKTHELEVKDEVSGKDVTEMSNEIDEEVALEEKMQSVTIEMQDEQANVKAVLDTEEGQVLYDEAMTLICETFGIELEELQAVMQELNVDLLDLTDKGNLAEVVQTVFNYDTVSEVLLDAEASQAFKTVNAEIETLVESLDIDLDVLEEQISLVVASGHENLEASSKEPVVNLTESMMSKESSMTVEQGPTLEVNDLRSDQDTSQLNQNNNGQNQGNQTFGELMSQQMTEINEVVAGTTNEQSDFQQIRTMEMIDQLVTKAVINLNNDKTSMQIQMNPEHLGKIAVSITAEHGVIKGEFVAENNIVKEMLESNMIQLKAQLQEQGIKVDKIEVALGSTGQFFGQRDQSNQGQQSSDKSSKRSISRIKQMMQVSEVEEIETALQQRSEVSAEAYTVEYSA